MQPYIYLLRPSPLSVERCRKPVQEMIAHIWHNREGDKYSERISVSECMDYIQIINLAVLCYGCYITASLLAVSTFQVLYNIPWSADMSEIFQRVGLLRSAQSILNH